MRNPLASWFVARTGGLAGLREVLARPVPAGTRWRYAAASALSGSFLIQAITGLVLMFAYSPSATTAWGSVYYLSYQTDLGWFVRGLHRFGSYATVILAVANLVVLAVTRAYRAPREIQWWLALGLVLLAFGLGVTGNILPWDQHGYWAAVVETLIAGSTPVVGPALQKLILGGTEFGSLTLTRIYALHVAVLPVLLFLALRVRSAMARKEEATAVVDEEPPPSRPVPSRALYALAATLAVWVVLACLVVERHGAELEAPANPATDDYPARPEWYFLWLFQLLKYFRNESEIVGTLVIPGAIVTVLALLPFFDRALPGKLAHFLACAVTFAVVGGAGFLVFKAWRADAEDPSYVRGRDRAEAAARRAIQLAGDSAVGIPPDGASYILARDPLHRGGEIVEQKCISCHAMSEKLGGEASAPTLKGYGTSAWLRGLLETPDSAEYFGKVPGCDGMTTWKAGSKLTAKELDDVADYVASFASIDPETSPAEWAESAKADDHPGRKPFLRECVDCHTTGDPASRDKKTQPAPDLFAWGSDRWVGRMIKNPNAVAFYGWLEEEQKMPAFGPQLTEDDLRALVRYLKGDYPPPLGGPTDLANSHAPSKGLPPR